MPLKLLDKELRNCTNAAVRICTAKFRTHPIWEFDLSITRPKGQALIPDVAGAASMNAHDEYIHESDPIKLLQ
ncbi:hypothetical protein SAMN05421579_12154 [Xenorhabdus japonica]|uniref:Uncharacterized protein n=1 Tax=Xenorhabdus japonica TaxID=53341 RepID=A0A1I5BT71_9GAMM|nr:hypothetical protein SAMN05421579_12154 [Xenorhabdus japonica]